MKVHELAKSLKLPSKDLLEKLKGLKIQAKSHMTPLDEKTVRLIKEKLAPAKKPVKPRAPDPKIARHERPVKQTKQREVPPVSKPLAPAPAPLPEKKAQAPPPPAKPAIPEPLKTATLPVPTAIAEPIQVRTPISVGALASQLRLRVSEMIKALIGIGVFANVNQLLSEEIVFKVASQLGIPVEKYSQGLEKEVGKPEEAEDPRKLKPRPPVVTLMGHVDHGKTTLLDSIRKSNVAAREAGQITQHIGAYHVDIPGKGFVTFLDTPGHAAFTAMRARGANVTDIVVLVVAADDGVMPQTIEAIDHARDAGVLIVVAINKCDHPHANPQKVMMQLQKLGLVAEECGGKTIFCKVSGKTGEGIDNLLEMLLLEAEVLELKANPDHPGQGAVIEGRLTKGSGPAATVIVQKGTLRVGDIILVGPYYGKVRALRTDRGKSVREAGPAYPVEVHGLSGVPEAGSSLVAVGDEKEARRIAEQRLFEIRARQTKGTTKHLTLENLHQKIQEGAFKELKLIIKGDVQGSVEALAQSLEKLSTEKVRLHVIHGGVGGINESDVMLAAASDAVIIGFHVKAEPRAEQLGEGEGVDMRFYSIIYEAVDDVQKAMEGLLEPTFHEVQEGRASVKKVFQSSKAGKVGGAVVLKGKLTRSSKVRLIRDQVVIFDGKLGSLKRFKDDVREVLEGYEFGFVLEGSADVREGDMLEAYRLEKGPSPKLRP